jgi:hypothetical protein
VSSHTCNTTWYVPAGRFENVSSTRDPNRLLRTICVRAASSGGRNTIAWFSNFCPVALKSAAPSSACHSWPAITAAGPFRLIARTKRAGSGRSARSVGSERSAAGAAAAVSTSANAAHPGTRKTRIRSASSQKDAGNTGEKTDGYSALTGGIG